jgi:hypothetical protein
MTPPTDDRDIAKAPKAGTHQAMTGIRDERVKRDAGAAQHRPQAHHGITRKTDINHRRSPLLNNILADAPRLLCNHTTPRSYPDLEPFSVMEHNGKGIKGGEKHSNHAGDDNLPLS